MASRCKPTPSHKSHGGQSAFRFGRLKDRPQAGRVAARQGRVLDTPEPEGSHLP